MKKRDKKMALSRETVRDLTTSGGKDCAQLEGVVGGVFVTCIPGGTTHCTNYC